MTKRLTIIISLIASVVISTGGGANAQIVFGQRTSARVGAIYTHWNISDQNGTDYTLNQLWFPISGYIPLKENFEAKISTSTMSNSLDNGVGQSDLSGLGDLRVLLRRSFNDDRLLLNVGLNLPTGKKELDPGDERNIIRTLSQSMLDFPARRYGQGLGITALIGGVRQLGELNVGASLSILYNGKYKPYEKSVDYDPGDMVRVDLAVNRNGKSVRWFLKSTFGLYTDDKSDGDKTFKQSSFLDLRLISRMSFGKKTMSNSIGYLLRGDNTRYQVNGDELALKLYGNEFHASSTFLFGLSQHWSAGPLAVLRMIGGVSGDNQDPFGSSHTLKLGGALKGVIARINIIEFEARYLTGQADSGRLDLSGTQILINYKRIF